MFPPCTNRIDNLKCVSSHDNLTCVHYRETHYGLLLYFSGAIGPIFLYNKQNNTWMLGNMKFSSRVELYLSRSLYSLVRYPGQHALEINQKH